MDPGLRRAWTEIVTADDYEAHMAAIGQAQMSAELTRCLIDWAALPAGSRITIAGAGTGQMFDFLDPALFRPYRLTCADLNPAFLARLSGRLARHGLDAGVVADDIERTALEPEPGLLLATLLLEHIDWRRGVAVLAGLRPRACGIILQENPPSMTTAVTPGRLLPPSIAEAVEIGHPKLVPTEKLVRAMRDEGYICRETAVGEVADGKRLAAFLFRPCGMAFTMATWNTLATAYIRPRYYPRTPAEILDPAWRIPAIVAHAQALGADLLCLQEVEVAVFKALQQGLGGYEGVHALKGGDRPDGCATFFRTGLFKLLNSRGVEYRDGSGHIVQCLLLEHQGKRLAVGNTHLKWDPAGTPREKQWGYRQILQAIETFDREESRSDGQIVCGDLNVKAQSDVVGALLAAGFNYAHSGLHGISTCNSNGGAQLIDYLFLRGSLKAHAVAPPPIDGYTALPSREQPSDHLALAARFDWL